MPTHDEISEEAMRRTKLVIQCFYCSSLFAGNICYEHHRSDCRPYGREEEHGNPTNFRPLLGHDKNPSFLCKWLDCNKCKLQKLIAGSKPGSFTSLRFRIICWARMTFLLIAKHRVLMTIRSTCKYPFLDNVALKLVVDFIT